MKFPPARGRAEKKVAAEVNPAAAESDPLTLACERLLRGQASRGELEQLARRTLASLWLFCSSTFVVRNAP